MDATTVLVRARSALEATAKRTAGVIRTLAHLEDVIPGSAWTVREAAIHLVNQAGVHTEILLGQASPIESLSPEALAAENDARIADIPESDPEKVASLLVEAAAGFLDATANRSAHQAVHYHAGVSLDLAALVGIGLGEQLLHGYDLAAAARVPWPIDPGHAELALHGYRALAASLVHPDTARGISAAYAVELRGGSTAPCVVRFTDGAYGTGITGEAVDCTVSADPVALLLVGSGRMTRWAAMALGLYSVTGGNPNLGAQFFDFFAFP